MLSCCDGMQECFNSSYSYHAEWVSDPLEVSYHLLVQKQSNTFTLKSPKEIAALAFL